MRQSFKDLAVTCLACKVIAAVVLMPLAGGLFRLFLAISGRSILADQDILLFFIHPAGLACVLIVGAVGLSIIAMEQAALMAIAGEAREGRRINARMALWLTARRAGSILGLAARSVARAMLPAAAFLAGCGAVYAALLGSHDINYYLAARPPVFWVAAALAGGLAVVFGCVLFRMVTGWGLALQLLLFEGVPASGALRASRRRMKGHRGRLARWVFCWLLAITVISAVGAGAVGLLGGLVLPRAAGFLRVLALAVGSLLLLWGAISLIVSLASAASFAMLLVTFHRRLGGRCGLASPPSGLGRPGGHPKAPRLSRGAMLGAAVAAVVLAAAVGAVTLAGVRIEDRIAIVAHRAGAASAPENTLAAVRQAIADGADWVEIDVQQTADGQIVVIHDSDMKKVAGVDIKIRDATAEQIMSVDVGSRFSPEFSGERVPTLDQVLAACKDRIKVSIELKSYGHVRRLPERVVEIVDARAMGSQVEVMSFKLDELERVRSLKPSWKVALLSAVALTDLTATDVDCIAVSAGAVTWRFVHTAHRRGKAVSVWTVNDATAMSVMAGRGVDRIITDKPALARRVLDQRSQMSPAERLLAGLPSVLGVGD